MTAPASQSTLNYVTPSVGVDSLGNAKGWLLNNVNQGGRFSLPGFQQWGTIATPLVVFTGATSGSLTLTTPIVIPQNFIVANSAFRVDLHVQRTGANGTANLNVRLGTLGSTSDNAIWTVSLAATNVILEYVQAKACFGTSTTGFFTPFAMAPNGTAAVGGVDVTTNCNTAQAMYLTFDVDTANASDGFNIIGVSAWLEI